MSRVNVLVFDVGIEAFSILIDQEEPEGVYNAQLYWGGIHSTVQILGDNDDIEEIRQRFLNDGYREYKRAIAFT